jgi:hypothetical protein
MKNALANAELPLGDLSFSLNTSVLRDILEHAKPLGHHEDSGGLNLGFGLVYYGLVRALRPRHTRTYTVEPDKQVSDVWAVQSVGRSCLRTQTAQAHSEGRRPLNALGVGGTTDASFGSHDLSTI